MTQTELRRVAELTPREWETLQLMAEGLSNIGIAERMFLTIRAVEKHVSTVLWKVTGEFYDPRPLRNRRVLAVLKYHACSPA